jgi:hypothetical protein
VATRRRLAPNQIPRTVEFDMETRRVLFRMAIVAFMLDALTDRMTQAQLTNLLAFLQQ